MKIELRNKPVKQVRDNHNIPGVIYGHGIDSTSIQVSSQDLRKALHDYGTSMTFEVNLEGEKHLVYIKDLQTDFLHNYAPMHVDLMKVSSDDTITSDIPLNFLNRDGLTQAGEVLSFNLNEVHAEAQVGKGVMQLDVDLSILKEADGVYIKDIVVPEGITLLHEPDQLVANITAVAELEIEDTTEDEDDELEVTTETVEDSEEETEEE